MIETKVSERPPGGFRNKEAHNRILEYLNKNGERVLSCRIPHWEFKDIATVNDVYNLNGSTVLIQGIYDVYPFDMPKPEYRYMRFRVSGNSSLGEQKVYDKLKAIAEMKEVEVTA